MVTKPQDVYNLSTQKTKNQKMSQKFYINNADIFARYFENGDYLQLCFTNLDLVKKTIREKSTFNLDDWVKEFL